MLFSMSDREWIHEARLREARPERADRSRSECSSQPNVSNELLRVGEVALEPAYELLQLG